MNSKIYALQQSSSSLKLFSISLVLILGTLQASLAYSLQNQPKRRHFVNQYNACFVHFVDWTIRTDYSQIDQPILLHVTSLLKDTSPAHQNKLKNRSFTAIKLRNLRCLLTFISVPDLKYKHQNRRLLNEQYPFWHWGYNSHFYKPIIAPQTIVIVVNHPSSDIVNGAKRVIALIARSHAPATYVLPRTGNSGWFVCFYCPPEAQLTSFNCYDWNNCRDIMRAVKSKAIQQGRGIIWAYADVSAHENARTAAMTFDHRKSCRLIPLKDKNCSSSEALQVVSLVFEPLNQTLLKKRFTQWGWNPMLSSNELNAWDPPPFSFVFTGYRKEFKFITSDSVQMRVSGFSLSYFAVADGYVWGLFTISTIAIALIISVILHRKPVDVLVMQNIFGSILEQSGIIKGIMRPAYRCTIGTWLVGALILTNSYKSVLKSNTVFIPEFKTNWSQILQLENFTLYFAYNEMQVHDNWTKKRIDSVCHEGWGNWSWAREHPLELNPCIIFDELDVRTVWDRRNCSKIGSRYQQYVSSLLRLMKNVQLFPVGSLEKVGREHLTKARTAFVVPVEKFDSSWSLFSKGLDGMKFDHNFDAEDNAFRAPAGYSISTGLGNEHEDFIFGRLQSVVTSGILIAWRKWAKLGKKNDAGLKNVKSDKGLSFENNDDILWVFMFAIAGNGLALVCCLLEWKLHAT